MIRITKLSTSDYLVKYGLFSSIKVRIELFNQLDLIIENNSFSEFDKILAQFKFKSSLNDEFFNYTFAACAFIISKFIRKYGDFSNLEVHDTIEFKKLTVENYPNISQQILSLDNIKAKILIGEDEIKNINSKNLDAIYLAFVPIFLKEIASSISRLQKNLENDYMEKSKYRIDFILKSKIDLEIENSLKSANFEFKGDIAFIQEDQYNLIYSYLNKLNIQYNVEKEDYIKDSLGNASVKKISFPLTYYQNVDYIFYIGGRSFGRENILSYSPVKEFSLNFIFNNISFNCCCIFNCSDFFPIFKGVTFVSENSKNDRINVKFGIVKDSIRSFNSNQRVRKIIDGDIISNSENRGIKNVHLQINRKAGNIHSFDIDDAILFPSEIKDVLYKIVKDNKNNSFYLISLEDFNKYCLYGNIPSNKNDVTHYFEKIYERLTSATKESILDLFFNSVLYLKYKDQIETKEVNNKWKLIKIIEHKEQLYFLKKLFSAEVRVYKENKNHQFVISKTKGLNNEQFGRKAEFSFNEFLKNKFDDCNWFGNDVDYIQSPSKCEIIWANCKQESFGPFDFCLKIGRFEYFIEVKSTRHSEEGIFYLSINELGKIIEYPKNFIIARLSFIDDNNEYTGVPINEEFYANFYTVKEETLQIIKAEISNWRDYYQENSIRFSIEHFDKVEPTCLVPEILETWEYFNINVREDLEQFESFIYKEFFEDFDNKLLAYGENQNLQDIIIEINEIRNSPKFSIDFEKYLLINSFPNCPSDQIPDIIKGNIINK